jgi:hypothetical protein
VLKTDYLNCYKTLYISLSDEYCSGGRGGCSWMGPLYACNVVRTSGEHGDGVMALGCWLY